MPGLFVTATGTGVGKTFVCAGLIAACRRAGRRVGALKPVISGFESAAPGGSDTAILLEALGLPVDPGTIAMISPWRFEAPLSPDMAAKREGRALDPREVAAACRAALDPRRLTIIEGVGGIMVPLCPGATILDVMAALGLPIVLVSPTELGAISHLLSACAVLTARGLAPSAIILSETPKSTVPLDSMVETVSGFLAPDRLFVLRRPPFETGDPGLESVFDAILAHLTRNELGDPD